MSFLGDNVKIHFAGIEWDQFYIAVNSANVNYRLYSCFKYIYKKYSDDDFTLPSDHLLLEQNKADCHVIQDSGLFTLMFGAMKGQKVDHDYLLAWQDKLIKFVMQNNLKATCVEIDCQKILGVDEAWYFRKRMKELLPNRQINVFHIEDGKDGFDRLIDFSDYIAISVPELRIAKPKTYKKDAVNLARYAKRRKPGIDIHMLGCTEYSMLNDISFCTSADSTSWLAGVKYGFFNDGINKSHIRNFKEEIFEERKEKVVKECKRRNINFAPKMITYTTNASLCATVAKGRYTKLAGPQD